MNLLTRRFFSFAVLGLAGTAVHFGVLTAGVIAGGWPPVAASSLGALAGALTNYALNYRLNYRSNLPHARTLSRFLLVALTVFVLNGVCMALFSTAAGLHFLWAQALTTALVLAWNFAANHYWTFAGGAGSRPS